MTEASAAAVGGQLRKRIARRKLFDVLFGISGALLISLALAVLAGLIGDLARDGAGRLNWNFLMSFPSRFPDRAGILSAWVGTIMIMSVTACTAIPLGVGAGLYLEEYAPRNKLTALVEINIANLAGVPSIIWGLMALGSFIYLFEQWFGNPNDDVVGLGRSVLTGGLTLGLMVLPIVIIATREAIRAIPGTIREAAYALGATRWQTVWHHIIPYSMGGILTGSIIAMSRAIGETAPLITIGALTYIAFVPPSPVQAAPPFINFEWLQSMFTVLPIQLFNWVSRPDARFHNNAAAAGIILVLMTLGMNAVAIVLRYRLRKKIKW
jgi:phosphate transport system permease protein